MLRPILALLVLAAAYALLTRWPRFHRLHWAAQGAVATALLLAGMAAIIAAGAMLP